MCNNNEFYFCEHCGNLIDMIHNAGVSVLCCGQKMKRIEPSVVEASQDRHPCVVNHINKISKVHAEIKFIVVTHKKSPFLFYLLSSLSLRSP